MNQIDEFSNTTFDGQEITFVCLTFKTTGTLIVPVWTGAKQRLEVDKDEGFTILNNASVHTAREILKQAKQAAQTYQERMKAS